MKNPINFAKTISMIFALILLVFSVSVFAQKKAAKMDTPTISQVGALQDSIQIQVTAGPNTGAPAGFSLQWMTPAAYAANNNQWYHSDDPRACWASFSGNAYISRYNLTNTSPGNTVTVIVGDFLFDNGASTNCAVPLICGTTYIFRAFAHSTNTILKSDWTANLSAQTLACSPPDTPGCTHGFGWWKTHGPVDATHPQIGNHLNLWPQSVLDNGLLLGTNNYGAFQVLDIMNYSDGGNGLIVLSHQLITTKLNLASGSPSTPALLQAVIDADIKIGNRVIPPVGTGSLPPGSVAGLTSGLHQYNGGGSGPGQCSDNSD